MVRLKSVERILSGRKESLPGDEVIESGYIEAKTSQLETKIGGEEIHPCHRLSSSPLQQAPIFLTPAFT